MRTVLLTLLGALGAVLAVTLALVESGAVNVAATAAEPAPIRWLLDTARERSVARRAAALELPADLSTPQRRRSGLLAYHRLCVSCHGAPGVEVGEMGRGLHPPPPDLQPSDALTEERVRETFWVIQNGIRMTGMPAYGPSLGEGEIWDLVAFVSELASLSPETYAVRLEEARGGSGEAAPPDRGSR